MLLRLRTSLLIFCLLFNFLCGHVSARRLASIADVTSQNDALVGGIGNLVAITTSHSAVSNQNGGTGNSLASTQGVNLASVAGNNNQAVVGSVVASQSNKNGGSGSSTATALQSNVGQSVGSSNVIQAIASNSATSLLNGGAGISTATGIGVQMAQATGDNNGALANSIVQSVAHNNAADMVNAISTSVSSAITQGLANAGLASQQTSANAVGNAPSAQVSGVASGTSSVQGAGAQNQLNVVGLTSSNVHGNGR
eukprot:GILJ01011090.1.p1 GENE.GILJ01011090.1~~GILJ01011090.1.p1  ORF type:complete len:254 (+),score=38.14 GILJ01011090.1:59-820(+)